MKTSLCNDWYFSEQWSEAFARGEQTGTPVRLPHTCKEVPLHYIDSERYQMLCGYRRSFTLPETAKGKRIFLQFDGAAHIATVYVNGREVAEHRCGYTAFRVEITEQVAFDRENILAVKLDTSENPTIPPFGFVVDYLTFGGLYREVWLEIRPQNVIEDIFVQTPQRTRAKIRIKLSGNSDSALELAIRDADGKPVWEGTAPGVDGTVSAEVPDAKRWDPESPNLYTCTVTWGEDRQEVQFGFRTLAFRKDGFYLNGKRTFLRGLNRHQCYPYVGYAVPEALQREDARILRRELGCTMVRTSHYHQSRYFLEECDRLGLLVFTEIPGWQHIGDEAWKAQACENVKEMVLQYRNHPSIVLWGVRINESLDDDPFYTQTNAIAHELDPSRATTGVRYIEKSHLLEDVYAYNDFTHSGTNPGAKAKKLVSPDMDKGYMISECNGHMYPTKAFDDWAHRQEHALRHARVQNAAYASGEHIGCLGWCMADYPTHQDFGSGDRICYHGVMDQFRNPKLAADFYASQADDATVLRVGSAMDIGEYAAGQVGDVYVFTNADRVDLYKNDCFVTTLRKSSLQALPHPPLVVDDTIGRLLQTQEGFSDKKAEIIRRCLLAANRYGLGGLPLRYKLMLAYCMVRYKMTFDDGVALFGKYARNWGGESVAWRFEAIKDGKTVKTVTCSPSAKLHLSATVSHQALQERDTYDMAAVRVQILDENGNLACYHQVPVRFSVVGDSQLVGPDTVSAEGGQCGTYIRTVGRPGSAVLKIQAEQTEPLEIAFTITDIKEDAQ